MAYAVGLAAGGYQPLPELGVAPAVRRSAMQGEKQLLSGLLIELR